MSKESEIIRTEEIDGYRLVLRKIDLQHIPGWINGYVTVPKGHPTETLHYDNVDVQVHGGLTYSSELDNGWTFGFDTAHLDDDKPEIQNEDYVWKETMSMLEQLKAME